MRETGIHVESEWSVQSYKCSSGIFTQQGSTVVYKEKQINLHNMESVHTRILTKSDFVQSDTSDWTVNQMFKFLKNRIWEPTSVRRWRDSWVQWFRRSQNV